MELFLHNDEQRDRERAITHAKKCKLHTKTIIWHSRKKTGVVFTCVLLGGYALQVRTIHILLTSVSQVHHVSIAVVVVALEWLSGVTTMSQHAHKKRNRSSWKPGLPMAPSGCSKSDGKLENCLTGQSHMPTATHWFLEFAGVLCITGVWAAV